MHCAGLYSLIGWLRETQLDGTPCKHNENTIQLHPIVARRFGIGFARGKYTNNDIFLAIQSNEHKWMKLIRWDKLYVRKNDPNLYFTSKLSQGDQEIYPDIPPFTLIIPLDSKEKIELLYETRKIEARELTYNEYNEMVINFSSKIFSITVKFLEEDEALPILDIGSFSSTDVILKKEAQAMSTEGSYKFIGDEKESSAVFASYQAKLNDIKNKWL